MVSNVSRLAPYNLYTPVSSSSWQVYPMRSNVKFINKGKLPKNHPWREQGQHNKKTKSDKFKIGCYIASGALFLGTIIYALCSKKVPPSQNTTLDNMELASDNMFMLGELVNAVT